MKPRDEVTRARNSRAGRRMRGATHDCRLWNRERIARETSTPATCVPHLHAHVWRDVFPGQACQCGARALPEWISAGPSIELKKAG